MHRPLFLIREYFVCFLSSVYCNSYVRHLPKNWPMSFLQSPPTLVRLMRVKKRHEIPFTSKREAFLQGRAHASSAVGSNTAGFHHTDWPFLSF
jgi:hypothetical protein